MSKKIWISDGVYAWVENNRLAISFPKETHDIPDVDVLYVSLDVWSAGRLKAFLDCCINNMLPEATR